MRWEYAQTEERGEAMKPFIMTADKAMKKLKDGNKKYLDSETGKGNISRALRLYTKELIVVLGHTCCGAVDAAIHHDPEGYIKFITDEIKLAIGDEKDDFKACCLNVRRSMALIEHSLDIVKMEEKGMQVVGAVYHIEDGRVEFL